jgi:hypothetical protein
LAFGLLIERESGKGGLGADSKRGREIRLIKMRVQTSVSAIRPSSILKCDKK